MDHPHPPPGSEALRQRLDRLLEKARTQPAEPGVYLMKDASGVVLYIGKALRLCDRVASYFIPSADLGGTKHAMLDVVHDFEVLVCESEWEALLTENRLIKDTKPRFNSRLLDDKTFPYLVVTQREDFPRVFVTRNPTGAGDDDTRELMKGAKVYGPFTNAGALREAVATLQRIFKFRTCKLDIVDGDEKNKYFRPCLLYNLNQCTAPCANKIGKSEYAADTDRFVKFLGTKQSAMLRELRVDMETAASAMKYEQAAAIRDQIKAIERLAQRADIKDNWQPESESLIFEPHKALKSLQKTLDLDDDIRCIEGLDIAHLQGNETVASKVCFIDGRPFKDQYRRYKIQTASNDDYTSIREVVLRRYREAGSGHELYPDVILIDGGLGQLHAGLEAFASLNVKPPMVISLAKKEELVYVQEKSEPIRLSRENLGLKLLQSIRDEAHRFAQHYHHILRRKKTLEKD
jgi:excinuclease ABC subunit C